MEKQAKEGQVEHGLRQRKVTEYFPRRVSYGPIEITYLLFRGVIFIVFLVGKDNAIASGWGVCKTSMPRLRTPLQGGSPQTRSNVYLELWK